MYIVVIPSLMAKERSIYVYGESKEVKESCSQLWPTATLAAVVRDKNKNVRPSRADQNRVLRPLPVQVRRIKKSPSLREEGLLKIILLYILDNHP